MSNICGHNYEINIFKWYVVMSFLMKRKHTASLLCKYISAISRSFQEWRQYIASGSVHSQKMLWNLRGAIRRWMILYLSWTVFCTVINYTLFWSQVQLCMAHLLPSVFGNLPLVIDVTLVAEHHFFHIRWSMLSTHGRTNHWLGPFAVGILELT